jgi:ribonuclease-3
VKITFERKLAIKKLQSKIDYYFNSIELLNRALTHSSYANEHKKINIEYNERLEFLGDSVLSLVVSDYIYEKYPYYPEGELTKLRATIVCESSLAFVARKINLGEYLLLGKGEEGTGGRERESILADAFEALIGAIYLDGGLEYAAKHIINIFEKEISMAVDDGELFIDYKTKLQEIMQKTTKSKIEYKIEKEEGPDHNKIFYMNIIVDNTTFGEGSGKSKKEAEQAAAKSALNRMGVNYE